MSKSTRNSKSRQPKGIKHPKGEIKLTRSKGKHKVQGKKFYNKKHPNFPLRPLRERNHLGCPTKEERAAKDVGSVREVVLLDVEE